MQQPAGTKAICKLCGGTGLMRIRQHKAPAITKRCVACHGTGKGSYATK